MNFLYEEIYQIEQELKSELFPNTSFDYNFGIEMDKSYWEEKIEENFRKESKYEAMNDDYNADYYYDIIDNDSSEEDAIDDLFIKAD